MHIDVIYACHVKIGDVVAGRVEPTAPTRPVQPMAHAMTVQNISEVPAAVYTLWYGDATSGLCSPPMKFDQLVMVIRGTETQR